LFGSKDRSLVSQRSLPPSEDGIGEERLTLTSETSSCQHIRETGSFLAMSEESLTLRSYQQAPSYPSKGTFRPIFVVGASRSGTSMLNRILGQHNAILAMNELHFFEKVGDTVMRSRVLSQKSTLENCARLLGVARRGIWASSPLKEDYQDAAVVLASDGKSRLTKLQIFQLTLQQLASRAGTPYITDQTPRNIFYASHLLKAYPNAVVLEIVRDPRAVLYSQKKRWRLKRLGSGHHPRWNVFRVYFNYHPLTLTLLWRKSIECGFALDGHPRHKRIFYEKLVTNPQIECQRLCEFLGLSYDPAMLEIPQIGSSHRISQPEKLGISAMSLELWRRNLSPGDLLLCELLARDIMTQLGYLPVTEARISASVFIPLILFPLHFAGVVAVNPKRALIQLKAISMDKSKR